MAIYWQRKETKPFKTLKKGDFKILITTDLFSILIPHLGAVKIHYDIPNSSEKYLRRIGRSGCFGGRGLSISLCSTNKIEILKGYEKYFNTQINELPAEFEQYF